ncbi:MAG: DNA-binding protein [Marmoricola sp.]|jgi:excisionase family DNA binding protein|nr:DNA-binding protein [Marmoricola sp.]
MSSPLKNYGEAAAWLNVSRKWLEAKVQREEVPYTRIGRHVRFTQAHLDEIVSRGERSQKAPDTADRALRPISRRRPR